MKNSVADGQEGNGLHWAIKLRWLLLEPGTHENNAFVRDVTGELEIRFPNVNIQIGAAPEGRNEKIKKEFSDNKEALLKGAKEVHKKMKSSAVTDGMKDWPKEWKEVLQGTYLGEKKTGGLSEYEWQLEQIVDYIKEEPTLIGLGLLARVFSHP